MMLAKNVKKVKEKASVVEAIAHLDKDFARFEIVRAAKSEAVVEQHAAVGDVNGLKVDGEALAEIFSDRKIKRDVRLEVVSGIRGSGSPVGKARGVGDVRGRVGMPRQSILAPNMKRVALIMIEEAATAAEGEIGEAAIDAATTERELIGISQINLAAVTDARGAHSEFPAVDARTLDGDGEKEIGIVEIVVIEEVPGAREEVGGVERPAVKGNSGAELMLFVALPMERDKTEVLSAGGLQEGAGNGQQGRRLIKVAIETAENPVEFWDAHRGANARAAGVLKHATGKMSLAKAGVEREPGSGFQLVLGVNRHKAPRGIVDFRRTEPNALLRIVAEQPKEFIILLREAEQAGAQIVALHHPRERGLAAFVLGSAVLGRGSGKILRAAAIARGVVVIAWRGLEHQDLIEGAKL